MKIYDIESQRSLARLPATACALASPFTRALKMHMASCSKASESTMPKKKITVASVKASSSPKPAS